VCVCAGGGGSGRLSQGLPSNKPDPHGDPELDIPQL